MRRTIALIVLALMLLPLASCGRAEMKRYEASFLDVFDTFSQIVIYATDEQTAQTAAQLAYDELKTCHRLFDIYNTYEGINNLKTINDSAGASPVRVDARVTGLMECAKDMYALTGGRMNVAMGSVLRLWHTRRTEGLENPASAALPDTEALKSAAEHTDISDMVIDADASTVYLADADMSLDVGAIAKGYATELAARALEQSGITSALLSIGGNVRAIGTKGDGSAWRTSIQNPSLDEDEQSLTVAGLCDMSLVSSGGYQRYYMVNGKRYHHIIDPSTLMPADYFAGVSAVTRDSALADALSTALFVMPLDDGIELIKSIDGAEALWVLNDGTIIRSDGFGALAGEE